MSYKRVAALAVSAAALTAGTIGASSAGADASANSAFALSASGLLTIDRIPNVNSTRGFAQDSVTEFSTPDRTVRARVLNAQAGKKHAKASVTDLTVDLSPVKVEALDLGALKLTATAVEASCSGKNARSSLAGARLGKQVLAVSAQANTKVEVPGVASVVLNKQVRNRDGSITVTAISIAITGVQTLDLASATCQANSGGNDEPHPAPTTSAAPSNGPDGPNNANGTNNGGGTNSGQAPRPTPVAAHLDVTG